MADQDETMVIPVADDGKEYILNPEAIKSMDDIKKLLFANGVRWDGAGVGFFGIEKLVVELNDENYEKARDYVNSL